MDMAGQLDGLTLAFAEDFWTFANGSEHELCGHARRLSLAVWDLAAAIGARARRRPGFRGISQQPARHAADRTPDRPLSAAGVGLREYRWREKPGAKSLTIPRHTLSSRRPSRSQA